MSPILSLKALLFFYYSGMTIIISYLPLYFQHQGLTGSQIGVILAIGPLAAMIAQPIWGFLTDKYKTSKKIIIICLVGAILSSFLFFQNISFPLLIIIGFVFFAFMSPVGGLADSLTQKTATQRSVSFGKIRMWGSLGFAVMSLLSGILLSYIGIQFIFIPFIIFILISLYIATKVVDTEASKEPIRFHDALQLGTNKSFIIFLFLIMCIAISHRANDSFLGIYLVEIGGNETYIGWAWFVGVLSEAIIFATATFWFRRFHPLTFMSVAAILFSIRWLIMSILQDPIYIIPLQMLHGLTFGVFYLASFQFVSTLIPKKLQSTALALQTN